MAEATPSEQPVSLEGVEAILLVWLMHETARTPPELRSTEVPTQFCPHTEPSGRPTAKISLSAADMITAQLCDVARDIGLGGRRQSRAEALVSH